MNTNRKTVRREDLIARLDAAIERTTKRRVALRLAERAMVKAREDVDRFDAEAAHLPPPVHGR